MNRNTYIVVERTKWYGVSYRMSTEVFTEETVSISAGNKTTIPKAARQRLNVAEGDKVTFQIRSNGDVVVEKADER